MTISAIREKTRIQPDAAWLPLLETATREVFEMMLSSPVTTHREGDLPVISEVTAMVGLAGAICGVVSIRCSCGNAIQMASRMLDHEATDFDGTVRDAMGEICNMVAGNFKAKITGLAEGCMLSVPTVISGADYHLHSMTDGGRVELIMLLNESPFWITLDLHS